MGCRATGAPPRRSVVRRRNWDRRPPAGGCARDDVRTHPWRFERRRSSPRRGTGPFDPRLSSPRTPARAHRSGSRAVSPAEPGPDSACTAAGFAPSRRGAFPGHVLPRQSGRVGGGPARPSDPPHARTHRPVTPPPASAGAARTPVAEPPDCRPSAVAAAGGARPGRDRAVRVPDRAGSTRSSGSSLRSDRSSRPIGSPSHSCTVVSSFTRRPRVGNRLSRVVTGTGVDRHQAACSLDVHTTVQRLTVCPDEIDQFAAGVVAVLAARVADAAYEFGRLAVAVRRFDDAPIDPADLVPPAARCGSPHA